MKVNDYTKIQFYIIFVIWHICLRLLFCNKKSYLEERANKYQKIEVFF